MNHIYTYSNWCFPHITPKHSHFSPIFASRSMPIEEAPIHLPPALPSPLQKRHRLLMPVARRVHVCEFVCNFYVCLRDCARACECVQEHAHENDGVRKEGERKPVCVFVCIWVWEKASVCICVCVGKPVCICMCMDMSIRMCMEMGVCIGEQEMGVYVDEWACVLIHTNTLAYVCAFCLLWCCVCYVLCALCGWIGLRECICTPKSPPDPGV